MARDSHFIFFSTFHIDLLFQAFYADFVQHKPPNATAVPTSGPTYQKKVQREETPLFSGVLEKENLNKIFVKQTEPPVSSLCGPYEESQ